MNGIYEYMPISFTDEYFSVLNCTIHSAVVEYKFRHKTLEEDAESCGIVVEEWEIDYEQ